MFLLWWLEGSGASAICPCFTNHHLAGIWQHVKSSQDSCFSTICWITKEITRLLGRLPDGKQVCLWVEDSYFLSMLSHAVCAEAQKWKGKEKENGEVSACVPSLQMPLTFLELWSSSCAHNCNFLPRQENHQSDCHKIFSNITILLHFCANMYLHGFFSNTE